MMLGLLSLLFRRHQLFLQTSHKDSPHIDVRQSPLEILAKRSKESRLASNVELRGLELRNELIVGSFDARLKGDLEP
jgi:hypothetical protein